MRDSGLLRVWITVLFVGVLGAGGKEFDGKAFRIEIADQANKSCSREHAIFRQGMFESMECRKYGYTKTAYTVQATGKGLAFRAVASSPREGTNTWTGVVLGDSIHGVLHWEKPGQASIDYPYQGVAFPLKKWPKELQQQVDPKTR